MEKGCSYAIQPPKCEIGAKSHTRNLNIFPLSSKTVETLNNKILVSHNNKKNTKKSMTSSFDRNHYSSPNYGKELKSEKVNSNSQAEGFSQASSSLKETNSYPFFNNYHQDLIENGSIPGFVSETDFLKQYKETNERISRLESLVWKMLNNSLPQLYDELDAKIQNSTKYSVKMIEEHRDTILSVINDLSDEIQIFKSSFIESQELTRSNEKVTPKERMHSTELQEVIEEESNMSESELLVRPEFSSTQNSCRKQSSLKEIPYLNSQENRSEKNDSESAENPDFYFSCHEKYMSKKQNSEVSCGSPIASAFDPRETNTMPNLSQSTLMDQIDYELDGLKVNEYSSELRDINEEEIGDMKQYQLTPQSSNK